MSDALVGQDACAYHLFLMPMTAKDKPDSSSMTPLMPIAGVRLGWMGKGFSGFTSTACQLFQSGILGIMTDWQTLSTGAQSTQWLGFASTWLHLPRPTIELE